MNIAVLLFAIALGVLAGLWLWLGLVRADQASPLSFERLVVVAVAVGLGSRLAFAWFTPTFYAPDEEPHFRYIEYLYEWRSLPVQTSKTDAPTGDWEYYQPPLYYLASVPIHGWVRGLGEDVAVRGIRLLSVALWCVTVIAALRILDTLHIEDAFTRLATISLVCLLPTFIFMTSVINNDNLLIALSSIILYWMVRTQGRRDVLWIRVLIGLALWVKLTAIVYMVALAILFVVQWLGRTRSFSSAIANSVLTVIVPALMWSPWAVRNLALYGDLTGESAANIPVVWPSAFGAFSTTLSYMVTSFWTASGEGNNVGLPPIIGISLTLLAVIGLGYGVFFGKRRFNDWGDHDLAIAFLIAIVVNVVLIFRFGFLYGQGQGRFLFPLLIPIAMWIALGFKCLGMTTRFRKAHVHIVGFMSLYALSFTTFSLGLFTWVQR